MGQRDISIIDVCNFENTKSEQQISEQKVRLIGNLIQTRFVFLKFEDRKCIETKKRVCSVKVESVSFHVVPIRASNSK